MTEPNRDKTPEPQQSKVRAKPWTPDPTIQSPGIFTRDARLPPTPPGSSFIEALNLIVGSALGIEWYVSYKTDDSACICGGQRGVEFDVAIHRPVNRNDDYLTTVDHIVSEPEIAAPLERILHDTQALVTNRTALFVGHVRKPVPENPFQPALLHVGIGNRWAVTPASSEENRIAEFVIWNIQVILWLREEARRYSMIPGVTNSPPLLIGTPTHQPQVSSPSSTAEITNLPLEKGWQSVLWPQGWNPFGAVVPWVGLSSPAIYQPYAFDTGYWLEYLNQLKDSQGFTPNLIETVRCSLPAVLGPDWQIEYRGSKHHILRHKKHYWIFDLTECTTARDNLSSTRRPFRILEPSGPCCPKSSCVSVNIICTSAEQSDAVARAVCDRRSGTCGPASSFFIGEKFETKLWTICAHLNGVREPKPLHPSHCTRPGVDTSAWWSDKASYDLCSLRLIWALKIFHKACLEHEKASRKTRRHSE